MQQNPSQEQFFFAVFKYTPKINRRALAESLNLTPGATTMRFTRLYKKLANGTVDSKDLVFCKRALEFSMGTDVKAVATETGMKVGAVRMRLTRMHRKFGTPNSGEEKKATKPTKRVIVKTEAPEETDKIGIKVKEEDV
jgi:hypothetical protein